MTTATDQYGRPVTPTPPGFSGMPAGVSSIPSIGGLFQGGSLPSSIPSFSAGNIGVAPQGQGMGPGYQGTGQGNLSIIPTVQNGGLTKEGYLVGTQTMYQPQQAVGVLGGQQTGGWMDPAQMRAATQSLGNHTVGDTGSGNAMSMGGASTGAAAGTGKPTMDASSMQAGAQATPGQLNIGMPPAGTAGSASGATTSYQNPNYAGAQPQSPQGSGVIQMQQQSPASALADYHNTAGYQNVNAPGAYQQSPGYQFATQDAMRQLQANASSNGLLQSGSALRAATNQAQGMAQQDYSNWWNRQNNQFDAYANRLAGLAGGNVGGDQAMNNGSQLAAGTTNMGQNVAGLLGNQGAAGYGGLVNTGAAQSSNMGNAATQQAQVNAANQSTQLAGAVYNRGLF